MRDYVHFYGRCSPQRVTRVRLTLGANRPQLVGVVIAQNAFGSCPGTVLGAVVGAVLVYLLAGTWPGWAFPRAIAVLTVLLSHPRPFLLQ
ncbi:MAG: FtsX-like permease family protein [Geodermatophilaceae bacterium]